VGVVNVDGGNGGTTRKEYENFSPDKINRIHETKIDERGMRIDREMYGQRFTDAVRSHEKIVELILRDEPHKAAQLAERELFERPEEFYNIDKLRKAYGLDWLISTAQLLYYLVRSKDIPTKDNVLDAEFNKFLDSVKPDDPTQAPAMKYFFKAYASDATVRDIIDNSRFVDLNVNPTFSMEDYKALAPEWRERIPEYVKQYVDVELFRSS